MNQMGSWMTHTEGKYYVTEVLRFKGELVHYFKREEYGEGNVPLTSEKLAFSQWTNGFFIGCNSMKITFK